MARASVIRRLPYFWIRLLFGITFLATGLLAAACTQGSESEPPTPPESVPNAPAASVRPAGEVTFSVTGSGAFRIKADGSGRPVAATLPALASPSEPGRYRAPNGTITLTVRETADGTFIDRSASAFSWWLASSGDPALVASGKGPAKAVEGVPLVVAWSPDSNAFAFGSVTGAPWSLHVANDRAALPEVATFEVPGGYVGELVFSPDSKYLAISTYSLDRRDHTVLVLELATGQLRTLSDGCHITWSPDSRYLAVHRDPYREPGAWVLAVDGSERFALSSDPEAFPHVWS
jgi:hypothetical protein